MVQIHFLHELGVDPQKGDGGRFYDFQEGEGEDGDVRRLRVRGMGYGVWGGSTSGFGDSRV